MFKYISEILTQFTPSQRIVALSIVLFSIVSITLGPSLIEANTTNCDDLSQKVKSLNQELNDTKVKNKELSDYTDTLNVRIRKSVVQCTDEIIKREKELLWQIERIERRLSLQKKTIVMDTITQLDYVNGKPNVTVMVGNDEIQKEVKKLKNYIKKDLEILDK